MTFGTFPHDPLKGGTRKSPDRSYLPNNFGPCHTPLFVRQSFPVLFPPEGTTAGSPVNNVSYITGKISCGYHGISGPYYYKQNWKKFLSHYIDYGSHYVRPFRVIHDPCLTRLLRIVIWILKIPLGILSYTLRIIQVLHLTCSPEGVPTGPRILNIRVQNKKGPNYKSDPLLYSNTEGWIIVPLTRYGKWLLFFC